MRFLSSFMLACILCGPAYGQAKAVIEGPDERRPGVLVLLSAEQAKGTAFRWAMLGAPEDAFATFEQGRKCVFSWDVPGEYQFFLFAVDVVDGKPSIDVAKKIVRITGPVKPPTPNPTPGPTPNPTPAPGKKTAVILRESADQDAKLALAVTALRNPSNPTAKWLKDQGHQLLILDDDQATESGSLSTVGKIQAAAQGKSLPLVAVLDHGGAVLLVEPFAGSADFVAELVKRAGG